MQRTMSARWLVIAVYGLVVVVGILLVGLRLGTDIFPNVDAGQFQLRLQAPTGTRVERTEVIALKALDTIKQEAGEKNVDITLGYVGTQPPSYPINSIYLWTSGPQETVLLVALRPNSGVRIDELKERLRQKLPDVLPGTRFSFEAGDVLSQVMNFGSPTPVEVAISGPNLSVNRSFADKVMAEMRAIPSLRDLNYGQPLDYPTMDITVDRERAGQLGLTVEQVGRSLVAATSSSRFVQPNYWRDPTSGVAYQVQVEMPQSRIQSAADVESVPAAAKSGSGALVGDVAAVTYGTMPGEYDRYNQQRMITITANIFGKDLGSVTKEVNAAINRAGDPPRGAVVAVRGQVPAMLQTLSGLQLGLALAIVVIFLLLAANFQSMRVALVTLSTVPAVIAGVAIALWLTGTTLNVQSFMGAIMSIGVSVANAILLVTFSESKRRAGLEANQAALEGARGRLRPILMTSMAMIAGMIPMALAFGQGGEQTSPLGRAVIGGLAASTVATLLILPAIFSLAQRRAHRGSISLHPDDLENLPSSDSSGSSTGLEETK
jgi:multidrug efflux pump subunit AcrB